MFTHKSGPEPVLYMCVHQSRILSDVIGRIRIIIDRSFIRFIQFTKSFTQEVLQWFNADNNSNFNLNAEDFIFGLPSVSNILTKKLNYTLLFLRYYIYKRKLQNDSPPLLVPDFINKIKNKYKIEKII